MKVRRTLHLKNYPNLKCSFPAKANIAVQVMPEDLVPVLDYITSPGIIIPTLVKIQTNDDKRPEIKVQVLLTLTIWYQWTLTSMLRESTEDLKAQVLH